MRQTANIQPIGTHHRINFVAHCESLFATRQLGPSSDSEPVMRHGISTKLEFDLLVKMLINYLFDFFAKMLLLFVALITMDGGGYLPSNLLQTGVVDSLLIFSLAKMQLLIFRENAS